MTLRTCVSPEGCFVFGIHRPRFTADNFRQRDYLADLGEMDDGSRHQNRANFPFGPVYEPSADPVFEIPNAFPFRGTTYIGKAWADARAKSPETIGLPVPQNLSFFADQSDETAAVRAIEKLPRPLRLALAITSTDTRDLCCLARLACTFCVDDQRDLPWGLAYERRPDGEPKAVIADRALFEAVANNPHLPDAYRQAMVLRPGAQGKSEIVGEVRTEKTHVFEYLRRNSYIPWGHYAANMANDCVRYDLAELTLQDMRGMRHLYYQRTYTRLARQLKLASGPDVAPLPENALESLRQQIDRAVRKGGAGMFDRTLWGWNYGFDYAPSGYRLHASHQQVHQQFALIPRKVKAAAGDGFLPAYACGDLVADFVAAFRKKTGKNFFRCYQQAVERNRRMDGNPDRPTDLVVFEDEHVMVFVPKAQTSQWELQLMPKAPVGNILEADTIMRRALDRALFVAVRSLGVLGARLISVLEYSKPLALKSRDQRLLVSFLPKLPESPGAFSEAQLRWINGHYPEDFAAACRCHLPLADHHDTS